MTRSRLLAVLFVCMLSLSIVAPAVGATAATPATSSSPSEVADTTAASTESVAPSEKIHSSLQNSEGTIEVIVRMEDAELGQSVSQAQAVSQLQRRATRSQERIVRFADRRDGVTVENRFWITNAMLLSVDTSEVTLTEIAEMPTVEELHANFDVQTPEPREASSAPEAASTSGYDTTYGLDQVNATEVWDSYGTQGEGVKVAVLDTGIDPSHPDIDLYTEEPGNATYPGGWAEFNGSGAVIPGSEPYDADGHGTHTSGTVAGGDASGEHIGVAPGATLIHGGVLTPEGGTFAAILGGMEWAIQEDADVMSMSLGCIVDDTACYTDSTIEPIQNAEAAGTIVIASAGNDGEGFSSSPGNVYDAVAIGASNESYGIADFSSGMTVNTSQAWGDAAPEHWPDQYVVPDVSAPGVAVKSAQPGGSYAELSGTSMAAPHVAGVVALMESAAGSDTLSNGDIRTTLRETAWKPEGEPAENDTRYGSGLVNAKAAVDTVALEQGVEGTVTGPDGTPVEGATVVLGDGRSDTTDESGQYSIVAPNGTYDVTVSGFGYESATTTVTVDGDFTAQNVSLSPTLDVELLDGQRDIVEGGENVTLTVRAANLESYTATLADGYSEADATLYVDGQEVPWGESIGGEPTTGTGTITITTAEGTSGNISVTHTFSGLGETVEVTTGPSAVYGSVTDVAVVEDSGSNAAGIVETLDGSLPDAYRVTSVDSSTAVANVDSYDALVVQNLDPANAGSFTAATADDSTGVVYLDNYGGVDTASNGIDARAVALDDPANTSFGYGDGVLSYEATAEHPILDGVAAPGESVQLQQSTSFNTHSWFNDTDAQVLANLETANAGVKGAGLAVDEERRDVLAATLGRWSYSPDGSYTAAADQLLANSVQWAAGDSVVEPAGTVDVTETTVQPGESGSVTVRSQDLSGLAGYQAKLTFNASRLQVTDVSGVDMADPVVNIDNENGVVYMAQAQASGVDAPEFVDVQFDVLMDDYDRSASVEWVTEDSLVTYTNGTAPTVEYEAGAVETAACAAGDVNQDGSLTVQDATLVQQYIVGQEPANFQASCADMNGDGQVTSADVTLILEEIVGDNVVAPQSADGSLALAA
ncbi:S8 family serine peptidase [Haloarchaeobius iranensis]|uniref:Serine protease, subtilisin family n=1 Tax=Haloarchaeobius iranensis TaxID=996166 RepID=A0A1G9UVB9_9EURY|nr:S8 family serine peptidase [Haloarchaeobius iranensis]SDM63863.1 Serine protease, subtilisin family [Haloarchaeobius iranensis]